jgi:hypothetical protein
MLLDDETGYPKKVTPVNSSPPAPSPFSSVSSSTSSSGDDDDDEDDLMIEANDFDNGAQLNGRYSDALEYFVSRLLTFGPQGRCTAKSLLALMDQIYTPALDRCNNEVDFPRIVDEVFKEVRRKSILLQFDDTLLTSILLLGSLLSSAYSRRLLPGLDCPRFDATYSFASFVYLSLKCTCPLQPESSSNAKLHGEDKNCEDKTCDDQSS